MRLRSFAPLLALLMAPVADARDGRPGCPRHPAPTPPAPGAPSGTRVGRPARLGRHAARSDAPAAAARPDIIVVYIDDVPPIDGRFWAMGRTPNIRKYIIDNGLTFRNAVDEAPLCCPARANLLSGLHTRNNHVTINDARLFDPSETIATELQGVGYHTAWIGKYLNQYISIHGAAHATYDAGWDVFEPMSGGSYGYYYWHKGDRNYTRPAEHSMQLVQDLSVATLRNAPMDQPLFAVLSTYAGHYPNIALPANIGSPKCAAIRRWTSPRYGAAATFDKPAWLQSLARRTAWRTPGEWLPAGQGVRGHAGGRPAGGQGRAGADAPRPSG